MPRILSLTVTALWAALALPAIAVAQDADKPAAMPPPPAGWTVLEPPDLPGISPKVERLVTEDRNARVDELRVRGEAKKVKVRPKLIPAPAYEIVVGDASREPVAGPNGQHGIIGQRVWELLEF